MAYLLTQEDIDKLGIMDAAPGDPALPEEMKMLGVSDAAPAPAVQAAPAVSEPAPSAASGGGILNFVMPPMPEEDLSYLTDPYANLSQTQRRLLAFAAIKDAGMALQGKDGGSFQAMLGDITARADMARKARAATAQQQMLATMFGGGIGNLTPEQVFGYVAMGILPPEALAFAQNRETVAKAEQAAALGSVDAILSAQTAIEKIDAIFDLLDSGILPTTGWLGKLAGLAGGDSAAAEIQNLNNSLQSQMSLDALKDLKRTGASLGGTSEGEIDLLSKSISELRPEAGRGVYTRQLTLVKDRYQQIINKIMRVEDPAERAAINQYLGYDLWAQGAGTSAAGGGTVLKFDAEGNPI